MNMSSDPRLKLIIKTNDSTSTMLLPEKGSLTIGRGEPNDIALNDPAASRRHAILHLSDTLRIEDLGSTNGVRVTTHMDRVERTARIVETAVQPGGMMEIGLTDEVLIGTTTLLVQLAAQEHEDPSAAPRGSRGPSAPIVRDEKMRKLHEMAALVATSSLNVLLLGETGVGKEVMSEAIHRLSQRAQGPLMTLNCAALSESLLESELFGHEAGSFTGAGRAKPGLFELAEKGTVMLDEVGEMPLSIQVKLLRVLEERKVLRVGGTTKRAIDVRFIAATNRDLEVEVQRGTFRQDLFFRLNGISMLIPPLRERRAEIEPLARSFMLRMAAQMKRPPPSLSEDALAAIQLHPWPGNIRELRNVMERAVVLSGGGPIFARHLGLDAERVTVPPPASAVPSTTPLPAVVVKQDSDETQKVVVTPLRVRAGTEERARILEALDRCGGNQTQAAEMLGISRRTLLSRLDLYGLPRPRKKD